MAPVQIFISYARADDSLPPDAVELEDRGFVTALQLQLEYVVKDLGAPIPIFWRDTRRIEPADQFDSLIRDGVNASSIMLVVLSPNWMESRWCKQELELFRQRWQTEGEERLRQRIVVACKRFVERGRRPSLLQGQQGYDFFAFEGPSESGSQIDFFERGRPRHKQAYHNKIHDLGGLLHRRAMHIEDAHRPPAEDRRSRTVYLAKPAPDMHVAYERLVRELEGEGYNVVPEPLATIPPDTSATEFIDKALQSAELSIHLLGERSGYSPEDAAPIVPLQLQRAAARLDAQNNDNQTTPAFKRIIWAPRFIDRVDEVSPQPDAAPPAERDAFAVLKRFGGKQDTDKVHDSSLSDFVDFLVPHLEKSAARKADASDLPDDGLVYVYHAPNDADYAMEVAEVLRSKNVAADVPALDGDPGEVIRLHRERLMDCNAVVLCWANASEVWARAQARELNWRKLGRTVKFSYRGLVALPPPGPRKSVFVRLPPFNEIDIVLDLTQDKRPLGEALEPLVSVAHPAAK